MILSRILSVLSAVCLVTGFTAATLVSPTEPLATWIAEHDHALLLGMQSVVQTHSSWLWHWVVLPVMARPVWLLPVGFGLLCLGAVVTLGSRKTVPQQRRRRS